MSAYPRHLSDIVYIPGPCAIRLPSLKHSSERMMMMMGGAVAVAGRPDSPLDSRRLHPAGRGDGGRWPRRCDMPQELQGSNWAARAYWNHRISR